MKEQHRFDWMTLPQAGRERLLQGGVGAVHVHEAAHALFQGIGTSQEPAALYRLGSDVLLSAWETMPLEPSFAATVLTVHAQQAFLSPSLAGMLRFLARLPVPEGEAARRLDLGQVRAVEPWQRNVREALRGEFALFAMGQALSTGLREQFCDWLERLLDGESVLPKPLKKGFQGDVAFAQGRFERAQEHYAAAFALLPLELWRVRQAEALYRAGERESAVALWHEAYRRRPWSVNLCHRLADVLAGRDRPGAFPTGNGAVLLYTWNKAEDMDATLASVAASELCAVEGEARIFALDNGSSDATPEVLARWAAHFQGRMEVITLPVNVGAPAARNWLLSLPEVKTAAWAAFLDDDVDVPRQWLRQLWDGVQRFPQSGVVSGHAVDYHAPLAQQWTDMHMVPLACPESMGSRVFRDRFKFTSLHEQALDFGDYRFMRPCVTAIGCCHLFTREALDATGGFDVRFSPSQSDDVDHDLRRGLAGHLPVMNGHLTVRHKRSTGYHKTPNPRSWASAVGNWYKLQGSYTDDEVQRLFALDQRLMLEDVQRCAAEIGEFFAVSPHNLNLQSVADRLRDAGIENVARENVGQATPAEKNAATGDAGRNGSEAQTEFVEPVAQPKVPTRVGVVVPAYNYAGYLPDTLRSILAQAEGTSLQLDVVVVDDGSTDETPAVLAAFADRIQTVRQPNAGLSAARNTGKNLLLQRWEAMRGEGAEGVEGALAFVDADDQLAPGTLAAQLDLLTTSGADIVVCRNRLVCGAPGDILRPADMLPWPLFRHYPQAHLCQCNIAPPHAWLLRARVVRVVGDFDVTLRACEDHDYWLRACAAGAVIRLNPDSGMALYRKHAQSMSAQIGNQLRHDVLLHERVTALLLARPDLFPDCRQEAWLAHCAGCLVTAAKLAQNDPAGCQALLERTQLALKGLAREMALKKIQRTASPELNDVRAFYAGRAMAHILAFAQNGSGQARPVASAMREILSRIAPDCDLPPQALARREAELMHRVYVDWV